MQSIFFMRSIPTNDHCEECGGEEYEGSCGKLHTYLVVVTTPSNDGEPPLLQQHRVETVCEGCACAIHFLNKGN